jgi:hypothetical protein
MVVVQEEVFGEEEAAFQDSGTRQRRGLSSKFSKIL